MEAALKQRLIGAAVLVALAVIFLPMLVDGPEPQGGSASVPIDIPAAPEREFETRELPLAAPASTPVPDAVPVDDPNRIVTVQADDAPRPDAMPEADASGAGPAPSAPRADVAPLPPASTPTQAAASATSAKPDVAPTAASPPPAIAPGTASVTPGGRFVVNLGSYGNSANAATLVSALKRAGLPAYTESTQAEGRAAQRVRLGPYAQRGEAEAARLAATRVRSDLPASVVALDTEAAAAAPAPVRAPVASGFAIQLGALKAEADANALRDRARSAGFTAFVERVTTDAGVLWRVRVGPEIQRANAERIKGQIAQKLQLEGVIVSHP
jgi:DedD protein